MTPRTPAHLRRSRRSGGRDEVKVEEEPEFASEEAEEVEEWWALARARRTIFFLLCFPWRDREPHYDGSILQFCGWIYL